MSGGASSTAGIVETEPTPAELAGITDPGLAEAYNSAHRAPEPPPIRNLREYISADIKAPPELVSPTMLVRGGVSAVVGAGGVGKTTLMLTRILRWGAGLPWFDDVRAAYVPVKPLKTLVVENEGAGGMFQRKVINMLRHAPIDGDVVEQMLENVLIWGEGGYSAIRLDDPAAADQVNTALRDNPDIDLVVMEPFARLWSGDENSNTEMNALLSALEELAGKHSVGILLGHHRRKGQAGSGESIQDFARGASALEGAVTHMEFLHRTKHGWAEVDSTKNRYSDAPGPYYLEWQGNDRGWYDAVDAVGRVLELIEKRQQALTVGQIKRTDTGIGEPESRVEAILEYGMRQKRIRYDDQLNGYVRWSPLSEDGVDEERQEAWDF